MPTTLRTILAAAALTITASACGGGLSKNFRGNVAGQMDSIKGSLTQCYTDALWRHRALRGTIILSFTVEAKTGRFLYPRVARTELADLPFEACVISQVNKLALTKPEKKNVDISTYPLQFTPLN